jgi:DNA-binding CsgD family transcriptional regulator
MTASLSQRELDVLTLTAQGRSQREAATQLQISRGLVKRCLDHAAEKLGATGLPHAIALAMAHQLIKPAEIPGGPA